MAKGLEMSGKDDLIKNSSITDVKEYTVGGESTEAAKRLAKKVDAEMEQIKSQGSLERLRLVRQVFDLTVPKRASVATAPFKIEAKHQGQGLLEAIANERPLLWAAFQEVPDLKLMAYASVMKGFDANVLEMGSTVSVDAAGKVHVTSPDGTSTHTADLFPWDIADAAEKRIRELEGAAAAEPEPTPAPEQTPAAVEPSPPRPDGRTPIVDGLDGAPVVRAVAPEAAPAPKEKKEAKEYTTEELQALVASGLTEGLKLDENTEGPHGLTVAINKIDSNAGLPTYVATIDFKLKSKNPDRSKSFHFEIEFDAQKDEDPSAFTAPINERVNKRVDRWERRMDRQADVAEEEVPEAVPAPTPAPPAQKPAPAAPDPAKSAPAEAIEEGPTYTQEQLQKLLPDVLIAGLDLKEGVDFVEGSFRLELNESESNIQANQYEARVLFVLRDELGDAGLKQVKFTSKFDGSLSDLNEIAAPIIAKMNRRVDRWENRLDGETDAEEAAPAAPEAPADKFEKLHRNRPYEYLHEETKVLIYSDRVVFNGEEYSLKLNGEDTPLLSIANNKDIVLSTPSLNRADDMADWSETRFPLERLFHQLEDGKTEAGYDFSKILLINGAAEPVARNGVKITLEKIAPVAPAPTETVDQKEEARKALEDQLNGDEVARQIMADIYAEYILVDGTAANDVRFKVSSVNGDRFKYTFKYMISKDGAETVYESDELKGNLKRLDEVKSFVKNRLLLDYKGNEMVRPKLEESAPAPRKSVDKAITAEHSRVLEDMQRLATQNIWKGVEEGYNKLLKLEEKGVTLGFDEHYLGARAANDLGNITDKRTRLKRAAEFDAEEVRGELENMDAVFRTVRIQSELIENIDTIRAKRTPLDPSQKAAIAWAANALQNNDSSLSEGVLLPKGDYELITDGEVVGSFSVEDEAVTIDTASVGTIEKKILSGKEVRSIKKLNKTLDRVLEQFEAGETAEALALLAKVDASVDGIALDAASQEKLADSYYLAANKDKSFTVERANLLARSLDLKPNEKRTEEFLRILDRLDKRAEAVEMNDDLYKQFRVREQANQTYKDFYENLLGGHKAMSFVEVQSAIEAAPQQYQKEQLASLAVVRIVEASGTTALGGYDDARQLMDDVLTASHPNAMTLNAQMRFYDWINDRMKADEMAKKLLLQDEIDGSVIKSNKDFAEEIRRSYKEFLEE